MLPKTTSTSFLQLYSFFYLKSTSIETQTIFERYYIYTWLVKKSREVPAMYIKLYFKKKCGIFTLALTQLLVSASSRISVFNISTQGLFSSFSLASSPCTKKKITHQKTAFHPNTTTVLPPVQSTPRDVALQSPLQCHHPRRHHPKP